MLVSFSVDNFRSFAGEETFSLVASNKITGMDDHSVPIPGTKERVLRTAVLYGANGAGKSNLFKALTYLRTMALRTRKKNSGTGREPFRFADETDKPSVFDVQFIAEEKLYRFGFKVDDNCILEEWLVEINGSRERELYERLTDSQGNVIIDSKKFKRSGNKLKALATIGGPHNQTFLATIRATLDASDYGADLSAVIDWFDDSLTLIEPDAPFLPIGQMLTQDSDFLQFASGFLKSSSTGIDHLKVLKREISEDELRGLLPDKLVSNVLDGIREHRMAVVPLPERREILVEQTEENHYYMLTVQAEHEHQQGRVIPLELVEESDGTQRLLNLIPALHHLQAGSGVFVIDEIDRSMHPMLSWKFLEFFLNCCKGEQRQLIVTTHESNLLDLELLRRDEIWFAEKDKTGATRLYPLTDFKVRKDLEVRKHYLQGRFGAVPFLGSLDRLLEKEEVPA